MVSRLTPRDLHKIRQEKGALGCCCPEGFQAYPQRPPPHMSMNKYNRRRPGCYCLKWLLGLSPGASISKRRYKNRREGASRVLLSIEGCQTYPWRPPHKHTNSSEVGIREQSSTTQKCQSSAWRRRFLRGNLGGGISSRGGISSSDGTSSNGGIPGSEGRPDATKAAAAGANS